jgi:hypothetical protein
LTCLSVMLEDLRHKLESWSRCLARWSQRFGGHLIYRTFIMLVGTQGAHLTHSRSDCDYSLCHGVTNLVFARTEASSYGRIW